MELERPIKVGVVDDYDVIVSGVAALLTPHRDLVEVIDCATDGGPDAPVDVALIDCFARPDSGTDLVAEVADQPHVGRVAVYTWTWSDDLVAEVLASGASAVLTKALPGRELAGALVDVHQGETVVRGVDGAKADPEAPADGDLRRWPGREVGLTERESEVLALITQGLRTAEIAEALYLSVNSIKTHTRNLFRKIGVRTRTEAALWGIDHGFRTDRNGARWRSLR